MYINKFPQNKLFKVFFCRKWINVFNIIVTNICIDDTIACHQCLSLKLIWEFFFTSWYNLKCWNDILTIITRLFCDLYMHNDYNLMV